MRWRALWPALAVSAAVHFGVVLFGALPVPDLIAPPPKVIRTRLLTHAKRVDFGRSRAAAAGPTASFAPKGQPKAGAAARAGQGKGAERPASEPAKLAEAPGSAVPRPERVASAVRERPASRAVERPASAPSKPASGGNHFPRVGTATFRPVGFSLDLKEVWEVRPDGYRVTMGGALFGRRVDFESAGRIGPNGIEPGRFAERRDGNVEPKYFAEFDRAAGTVRYGESANPKTEPLLDNLQDFMSVWYQLAATLEPGKTVETRLIVRDKILRLGFEARNEETIELPVGTVRTAHVIGRDLDRGQQWEAWLDLDHQNFPVRVRGVSSDGKKVDLQLAGLEFEGRTIYRYRPYETRSNNK